MSWSSVKAHVLYGEYKSGSVSGYHKKASSEPLVKGNYKIEGYGTKTDGANGTYYRSVHAAEKKSGNKWKAWVKKGKQSTFFPDNMGEDTIKETVEEASSQGEGLGKVTTGPMRDMKKIGSTTVFRKLGDDKNAE